MPIGPTIPEFEAKHVWVIATMTILYKEDLDKIFQDPEPLGEIMDIASLIADTWEKKYK